MTDLGNYQQAMMIVTILNNQDQCHNLAKQLSHYLYFLFLFLLDLQLQDRAQESITWQVVTDGHITHHSHSVSHD